MLKCSGLFTHIWNIRQEDGCWLAEGLARGRGQPAASQGLSKSWWESVWWVEQTLLQLTRLGLGTHLPRTPTAEEKSTAQLPRLPGISQQLINGSTTLLTALMEALNMSKAAWRGAEAAKASLVSRLSCQQSLLRSAQLWGPLGALEFCKEGFARDNVVYSSCSQNLPHLYRATSSKERESPYSQPQAHWGKCSLPAEIKVQWHMKEGLCSLGEMTKPSALGLFWLSRGHCSCPASFCIPFLDVCTQGRMIKVEPRLLPQPEVKHEHEKKSLWLILNACWERDLHMKAGKDLVL